MLDLYTLLHAIIFRNLMYQWLKHGVLVRFNISAVFCVVQNEHWFWSISARKLYVMVAS